MSLILQKVMQLKQKQFANSIWSVELQRWMLVGFISGALMLVGFFVGAMLGGAISGLPFGLGTLGIVNIVMCMASKILLMPVSEEQFRAERLYLMSLSVAETMLQN